MNITLSDWELLALTTLVRQAAKDKMIHAECGKVLADKLDHTVLATLMYEGAAS